MAQVKKINMIPDSIPPYMRLSQYDVGREIEFDMRAGSDEYEIPSGATVTLEGTKPSGLGFTITCAPDGSKVTAVTTDEMTDEWGAVVAELVVRKEDIRIGSSNVRFEVERSPHPTGTTDGKADEIIPALTRLLVQVQEALADAEEDVETMKELKEATETAASSAAASAEAAGASQTASETAKTAAETAKTDAETAKTAAEEAATKATELVAGCITIDAETSELIIYE